MVDDALSRGRSARVLVLEDHAFFQQLLGLALTAAGYEVVVSADGRELLAEARRRRPDLLVLDIDVPGLDGLETLKRCRRVPGCEQLPAMMASARAERSVALKAQALGAEAFLRKPYSLGQLTARVAALLAAHRQPEVLI